MKIFFAGLAGLIMILGSTSASAERFQFEKTENGLARLDTQTGQVSLCRMQQEHLICRMAADDRQAYEQEISRLQNQQPTLKEALASLELMFDEGQMDDAVSSLKGVARGILDVMRELQQDFHTFEEELNQPESSPENRMKL